MCVCLPDVRSKPTFPRTYHAVQGMCRPFSFPAVPLILPEVGHDTPSFQSLGFSLAALLVLCMVSPTSWVRPLFLPLHARPPPLLERLPELLHPGHPSPHTRHLLLSSPHLDSLQSRRSKFPSSVSAGHNP
jgi:hypothetical protein